MKVKEFFALILALVLCIVAVPANVFAENTVFTEPVLVNEEISENQGSKKTEEKATDKADIKAEEPERTETPDSTEENSEALDLPNFNLQQTEPAAESFEEYYGAAAKDILEEGDYQYKSIENGVEIVKYTGNDAKVVIPDTLVEKEVVSIGEKAFANNKTLESVDIGRNVQKVGEYSFYYCEKLSDVNILASLTTIGNNAFSGCYALYNIEIPASVATIGESALGSYSGLKIFGEWGSAAQIYASQNGLTFIDVKGAKKSGDFYYEDAIYFDHSTPGASAEYRGIRILSYEGDAADLRLSVLEGQKIVEIGKNAFRGNGFLKNVSFGPEIRLINNGAFAECKNLKNIELNKGLIEIQFRAFGATAIEQVVIPESVKILGGSTFSGCKKLKIVVTGAGVTEIPDSFSGECETLEAVTFKGQITKIGSSAFRNCKKLTDFEIPKSVITIDYGAFAYCTNMHFIEIPENVTNIGGGLFSGIESIVIKGTTGSAAEQYAIENNQIFITDRTSKSGDFYYDDVDGGVKIMGYTGTDKPKLTLSKIEGKNIIEIGFNVFRSHSELIEVNFGTSVKKIGNYAFYYCQNLSTVHLNEGLEKIDHHAFSYSGVTTIDIPDSVKELGVYESKERADSLSGCAIFEQCNDLKSVTVGAGLSVIPAKTFSYCEKLKTVDFKEKSSLIEIGSWAFAGCDSIKQLSLPEGLQKIQDYAFYSCDELNKAIIPASITNIHSNENQHAFSSDNLLCIFGKKNTQAEAFAKRSGIPFVSEQTPKENGYYYENIEGGVKIIRAENTGNASLPEKLGGEPVIALEKASFVGDMDLTEVSSAKLKSIGGYAFKGCENLKKINIGSKLDTIGEWAFSKCKGLEAANISTKALGAGAFTYCDKLSSVTLSDLEKLESTTFGRSGLKSLTLPDTIKILGEEAILQSNLEIVRISSQAQNVTLENNSMASDHLKSAYLPSGVTIIRERTFGWQPPEDLSIYGEAGTVAEAYANAHNITFSTEMWQQGDVNKDSNINASDALMDLQHAVKELTLTGSDFIRGDVNKDNIVNASDGLQILRYSVKEINHFD